MVHMRGHGVAAIPAPGRSNRRLIVQAALYGLFATSVKPAGCSYIAPIARRLRCAA